jgi:hypothetical protein
MGTSNLGLLNGMIQERPSREILHEYTIMSCFAVRMKLNGFAEMHRYKGVSIYKMGVVSAIAVQSSATWGLDRSDQITGMNMFTKYSLTRQAMWTCTF